MDVDTPTLPVISRRSEDLFLADGNIILRTRSVVTEGEASGVVLTHYKVHKAILGLNSAAFKDLLEGTSDDAFASSEMFEGVPVMDTHDEQDDLDIFLKAIYIHDWIHNCYEQDPGGFIYTFERLLKLAKKYDAAAIRLTVTKILEKEWPHTCSAWQHVVWPTEPSRSDRLLTRNPVMAVRLGFDYDIPKLLPAAMYELYTLYELYDHTRNPANAVDHWSIQAGDWLRLNQTPLDLSRLDLEDYKRLWLGRGALRAQWINMIQHDALVVTLQVFTGGLCDSAEACARAFDEEWKMFRALRNPAVAPDPIKYLQNMRQRVQSMDGMCVDCREETLLTLLNPDALWGNLCRIFNLPDVSSGST